MTEETTKVEEVDESGAKSAAAMAEKLDPAQNPAQQAVTFLNSSMEEVNKLVSQCSTKQLKRVVTALTIQPFNQVPFHFSYRHEEELYNVLVERERAKGILFVVAVKEQEIAEEIKQRASTEAKQGETEDGKQEN